MAENTENVQNEAFDWEAFETKGFGEGYSKAKREELAKMYDNVATDLEEQEVDTPSMGFTKKGNALYYYKKALKMKDTKKVWH